ncbi:SLBB domain-containing protein [Glaciecola sp. MF2-115]|uniref:SLBB domain-containing protein n=1 Tax=Glaciecola sp. MF2-115 TaxID=3384827 RepID=UPI0039A21C4E
MIARTIINSSILKSVFTVLLLSVYSSTVYSQSFVPSQKQIEQFKNLPRAQQEQLASQMGFDISMLDANSNDFKVNNQSNQVDFVERNLDSKKVSAELAKQSVVETSTAKLKPFGYDIFESREQATKPNNNIPVPPNYSIGPGDSVKLQLFGQETGSFQLEVNNEGNIDLPDLGPLNVAGTTFTELKELVKQKYEQQKIGVTPYISMGQLRTIQIFLVGEVYQPGPLVVTGLSTVTTALINSGGVNEIGSLRNIEIKRDGKTVSKFDLYELIVFGNTTNDIRLEQGDVLFVPTAQNVVSVEGQVRRPAIYELKDTETVADLFKLVGGFLPSADTKAMQLVRANSKDGLTIVNLSLSDSKIMNKVLRNGDFIRVPKAHHEFNNAIVVTGAINLPNIIAETDLSLKDLITKQTILTNTDLNYALVARKARFDKHTTIIQFKPLDVLSGEFNLNLQAFDELIVFNKVGQNIVGGVAGEVVEGNLKASQDDLKNRDSAYLQKVESSRFTTDTFAKRETTDFSRKALLAPLIARLKNEADNNHPVKLAEVTGQVKFPGVYPLSNSSVVGDMLVAAGGLTEAAHLEQSELTSVKILDGVSSVTHKSISLIKQLLLPKSEQLKLESKDILNVVRIPQWYENNVITLNGEVVFPGSYQVSEGETLSSVLARAGGLTDNASIKAAVFTREELKEREAENIGKTVEDLREQLANNNLSNSQFSRSIDYQNATAVLDDLTNVKPIGRLVIDLEAVISGDSTADILIKNGDSLTIPNITPAVSVIGEVFVSTTHMFEESLTVQDYIQLAGGIREYGDDSMIYIVKANGSVVVPESNFWFSSGSETYLEPGDTIVVPRDVTNYDNISLWQGVTQIIYQSAVALAAIGSL